MATTTIAPNSTYEETYLSTEDTVSQLFPGAGVLTTKTSYAIICVV